MKGFTQMAPRLNQSGAEGLFPTKYVHPAIESVLMRNSCCVGHQSQANLLACIEIAG